MANASTRKKVMTIDGEGSNDSGIDKVIKSFNKYIEKYTSGTRTNKMQGNRPYELHPSSYPYCGLWHVHEIFENGEIPTKQEMDYYGNYYTGLGSFKHSLIQDWLGRGARIVGNYICENKKTNCNYKKEFSTYHECPKCGKPLAYHELGIKFKKYTRGHLDGVYLYKGKYYIIDYKTTGEYKLFSHKTGRQKFFPHATNKAQIESYCYYVEKNYGIKISGWMLIYVSRDKSFRNYVTVGEDFTSKYRKKIKLIAHRYEKHFSIAIKAKTYKDIIPLIEEKPCKCKNDYLNEFHDQYNPCPVAINNTCFKPKKLEAHFKKISKNMKG